MCALYAVLYTPHLTQKRKTYHDGQMTLDLKRQKAVLLDLEGRPLAQRRWVSAAPRAGDSVHFQRFIVEVDSVLRGEERIENEELTRVPAPEPVRPPRPLRLVGPPLDEILHPRQTPIGAPIGTPIGSSNGPSNGPSGTNGSNGPSGTIGSSFGSSNGLSGTNGFNGLSGTIGSSNGLSGTNGSNGPNGTNGSNGLSGTIGSASSASSAPSDPPQLKRLPETGPWTQEALLLFSFRPPSRG